MNPYLFDEETAAIMIMAARAGATTSDVADMAGIGRRTLYDWLADPNPTEELRQFQTDWKAAKATGRTRLVTLMHMHAESDWRAAAWILERVDPVHWGKTEIAPDSLQAKLTRFMAEHADEGNDEGNVIDVDGRNRLPALESGAS